MHVRVRVGGEQYALPVEQVDEVLVLGEVTPVPGAADAMLGLQNLSGEIVPAFELAGLLEIEHDGHRAEIGQRRLVVAEHDGRRAAFAVDEVIDVGRLPGTIRGQESSWLLGSTVLDGALVGLLAVDVLFDSLTGEGRE